MNKKVVFFKLIGCLLVIFPFFYNRYSFLRALSVVLGIMAFIGSMFMEKKACFKILLFLFISCIIIYGMDYVLVRYVNRVPIISYEIKSSKRVSTYNSFFYRVYNCNNAFIFDSFYEKNYVCDITLPEENVNSLLSHIVNNYKEYRNKFVNVNGKISAISGSTSIAMQVYENKESSMNGQVSFGDNVTLTIMNEGKLTHVEDLKIYDTINVIGRIAGIKNNGENKEIIMKDAKIISRNSFKKYEISIIENKSCEADLKLISKTDEYTYYSKCLDSIFVKYDQENIYDLGYVLTDKRMTFEQLTKNIEKKENDFQELYQFDEFRLIKCKNSNNIIIGNNKLKLDENYCEHFNVLENTEEFEGI